MRKSPIYVSLFVLLLASGAALAEDKPDPSLTPEERAEFHTLLNESMEMFTGLISDVSDEQWNFKQNADRWSVAECAEHIVRAEELLLAWAKEAIAAGPNPEWAEKTKGKIEFLSKVMPNRNPGGAGGAQAPFEIRPSEHWDRATTIRKYFSLRGEVLAYFETLDLPIKEYTKDHPFPVFNTLNAHQWLVYIPLHTIRHSRQIVEVKEDAGFPK